MAKNKPLQQHVPDIKTALDMAVAEHLAVTQGKLAKANPKDTGRMASSWYIGHNNPPSEVRSDPWADPGAKRVEVPEYSGQITADGTWYITNNVAYADRVCYDPIWAKNGSGGPAWFTSIATQQPSDISKTVTKYLRRVG